MQKANYPRNIFRDIVWYLKSGWEDYVRTGVITAAVVAVAVFTATPALPSKLTAPSTPQQSKSEEARASIAVEHSWFWWTIWACAAAYAVSSWSSIIKDAKRRRYDPTLALKYNDILFKDNADEREIATKVLIKFHTGTVKWENFDERPKVDPVLDTLDDIGFLFQGDQISDRVVYQYFSYWVQLYYEAAEGYIKWRRDKDDSIWEHLPGLYDEMMKIMAWKNKTTVAKSVLGDAKLLKYLKEELDAMPPKPT